MADDDNVVDQEENVKKAAKHDSKRAADLEKVTDYVEEAEIGAQDIGNVSHDGLTFIIVTNSTFTILQIHVKIMLKIKIFNFKLRFF